MNDILYQIDPSYYLPNMDVNWNVIPSFECDSFTSNQSVDCSEFGPTTSLISEEFSISDNSSTQKRSHSPIILRLPRLINNTESLSMEHPSKKRKTSNITRKKSNPKIAHQRIINQYWDPLSRQVVKEQLERDERIRIQQEREEQSRYERTLKQQKYNGALIKAFNQEQPIEFELVLETDPETDSILIGVPLLLVIDMKPHQIDGVKFLWNQVFESTSRIAASIDPLTGIDHGGSGAILAHCMGLGKTFTTIVLIQTLFQYSQLTHIHRVLILCPINTAINWKSEFDQWLGESQTSINIYLFSNEDIRNDDREEYLRHWHEQGGVLLMGYEMYRQLTYTIDDNPYEHSRGSSPNNKKVLSLIEQANIDQYRQYLRDPGPDLIVCDEGHIIKNPKSAIACTLDQIRTHRRIILTGTPMQNNLKEYFAMVNFCKPNFLGTQREFSDHFRIPIEAGQHSDSSPHDVAYMRRRIYLLNRRLQNVLHRQGFDVLRSFLPPKFEYAIKIKCRPVQRELYETYIRCQNINALGEKLNVTKLFGDYQYLMKIWTHPWLLQPCFKEFYLKGLKENAEAQIENIFEEEFSDDNGKIKGISPTQNNVSSSTKFGSNSFDIEDFSNAMKKQWWFDIFDSTDAQFDFELSGKITILKAILDECDSIGDKLLVFSRSLMVLDYLEQCLAHWSEESSLCKWEKGVDYFRIDGKIPIKQRASDTKLFNDVDNTRSRLYLISTLAGGMGINLFSANRVIILDTSWNPAHDLQAMFRSYRLGQTKPVYIYRLIVQETMEEKIYKRQITKQAMFHRVVDAKQLARHFTHDELAQLYQFDFDADDDLIVEYDIHRIQDGILRHLIQHYRDTVVSYLEHDSFLMHRDEENLTTEEKIQASNEDDNPSLRLR